MTAERHQNSRHEFLDKVRKSIQARYLGVSGHDVAPAPIPRRVGSRSNLRRNTPAPVVWTAPRETDESTIFITGGIGDVFALESFMSEDCRQNVKHVIYGSPRFKEIQKLFDAYDVFPALERTTVAWSDFSDFFCFFKKEDCLNRLTSIGKTCQPEIVNSTDWSIFIKFPQIRSGQLTFHGSSFLKNAAPVVEDLPENYFVVCPYSNDKSNKNRDFDKADWDTVIKLLARAGTVGVVMYQGSDPIPVHPLLINKVNSLSIEDSISVLRSAQGYFGIDTCFSVLAAQLFQAPNLLIKTVNKHCTDHQGIYYAPQTDFSFLKTAI